MSMTAQPRKLSESGIYHVMLRGINQTQLFYEDEDYHVFLERLERFKDDCGFDLLAYSLMGNHVHLLVRDGEAKLSLLVKKVALSYSHWFNAKYDRSGYLFSGRFKSEPVEDDAYFLAVLRYIHNNPVKVGEATGHWTSYDAYLGGSTIVNTDFALVMFSENRMRARELFQEFIAQHPDEEEEVCLGEGKEHVSDSEAIEVIKRIGGITSCNKLADLEREKRNQVLTSLKKAGLSIRQIARLTGINRGIVQKARE